MLKNITFSAEENLIKKAREKALAENTTLNEEFRRWLEGYIQQADSSDVFEAIMASFAYAQPGRTFKRDEMNER